MNTSDLTNTVELADGRECRRYVDHPRGRCVETPTVVRKPRVVQPTTLPTVVRKPRVVQYATERAVTDKPPARVREVPTTLPTVERSIVNNHIGETTHIAETPRETTPVRRSNRQRVAPAWQADYVVK